jgi:hypothetical protein
MYYNMYYIIYCILVEQKNDFNNINLDKQQTIYIWKLNKQKD